MMYYNNQSAQFNNNMQLQTIINRISECIDDLGSLLDHIYKFPQKQREQYFDKIQTMKNRLLTLKYNAKQANTNTTQKHYKQLYLNINSLKTQINQQITLTTIKQRQINRPKDKQIKKNHIDAMKLLVQKEQQINELKKELLEKQQLIKINYQELKTVNQELSTLISQNSELKQSYNSLEIEFKNQTEALMMAEQSIQENQVRNNEKDGAFDNAIQELQKLKNQLITANSRIIHFEQLAQININKTRIVEQNMRKIEQDAQDLTDNFRIKQTDILKKARLTSELEYQLANSNDSVKQLQLENKRLRQDIQVLQNQTTKLHKNLNEAKSTVIQVIHQINCSKIRQDELKRTLKETESKYLIAIDKLTITQQYKLKIRQLEIQILKIKEKSIMREQENIKLYQQLEISLQQKKQFEKKLTIQQIILKQVQQQLISNKTSHQKQHSRNTQTQNIKIRLLKAKIQAIHQLRQIL